MAQPLPPKVTDVAPGNGFDRQAAWGCVLGNLVLPGLGTFAARRKVAGVLQLVISQTGFGLAMLWAIMFVRDWMREGSLPESAGPHFGLCAAGLALFFLAWIWSLASSVDILLSSRKSGL